MLGLVFSMDLLFGGFDQDPHYTLPHSMCIEDS